MPGLLGSLLANSQALDAHQQALQVTGKNLANVNNPAYARQRVMLGSQGTIQTTLGNESMGVAVLGLQQMRDILLDRQMQREVGLTASLDAKQSGLMAAESALGQTINRVDDAGNITSAGTDMGAGLNENLSMFFSAFESWSVRPSDPGEKQLLLQKAAILVEKINTADSRLAEVQTDLTEQVEADVVKVNEILDAISNLNTLIGRAETVRPNSAVDLRDERQAKIEELSEYFDFTVETISGGNGQVRLYAQDGSGNAVDLVNPLVTGAVTFNGTNFSAGNPSTQLSLSSGSLQARVDVRDGTIASTRADIKKLADQLTLSVNAAYNPASDVGRNFFKAVPATGLIEMEVTLSNLRSTTSANTGANELAVAVAALATKEFSTGGGDLIDGSFSSYFSGITGTLGLALSSAASRLEDQELSEAMTRESRDAVSAVSQDEELTNLLRFQRSFQASARFTNVVDQLLDTVVNNLGRF